MTISGLELTTTTLVLLVLAGFAAGWVDAVVGGGGLVQLPALLLIPGISPVQALATNKVAGILGTSVSAATFYRRVQPGLATAGPMALTALLGAGAGAALAGALPVGVFKPVILVALVAVAVYTVARPQLGRATSLRWTGRRHLLVALGLGAVIGCYDGLLGPGTGSFLVIALVSVLGYGFLEASAQAKIVNVATNFGALVVFTLQGAPLWGLGLVVGVANIAGGYAGARTAVARGSAFVRVVFVVIVLALVVRLAVDVLG
ncbi:TSUP family transporter [Cellulomonas sp. P22]|uniref:TSUP family transporter n=1 Tax=Cellulomonas sp. P22 TaxID=3373189 RepID=UPI0037B66F4E